MGISSLNSAILYSVSLYFHLFTDPHVAALLRMTECHLERPQGVERSKSYRYNKYPDPGHKKGLFSGRRSHFAIHGQENGRFSGQEKKKPLKGDAKIPVIQILTSLRSSG